MPWRYFSCKSLLWDMQAWLQLSATREASKLPENYALRGVAFDGFALQSVRAFVLVLLIHYVDCRTAYGDSPILQ